MRKEKAKGPRALQRRIVQYRFCKRPGLVVELVLERKLEPRLAECRE